MNNIKNSYQNFSKVLLESIQDSQIDDENLEPQLVRTRHNNNSFIYLDSTHSTVVNSNNPAEIELEARNLFTRKIRRFTVVGATINMNIPNVNPINNLVRFRSSVGGAYYSATVPMGYYLTASALVTALITAMNLTSGVSGLTFSAVVNPIDGSVYTINSAGGNFYFDLTSPMYENGLFLINLNSTQTYSSSLTIGPIQLYYTRYIDIYCPDLLAYDKNPSNATDLNFKNSNLVRLYLYVIPGDEVGSSLNNFYQLAPGNAWKNFNRTQSISSVKLSFYDEYGNYLYIPNFGNNNYLTSFWCQMILLTEL